WSEADGPASFLQSPTYVNVVTSDAESRIKTPDGHQLFAAVRHIAAGNVLGDFVRQQHVNRSARRICHAVSDRAIAGRREIGTSNADMLSSQKGSGQISQPVRIRISVVVDVGNDFACGRFHPLIARYR